MPRKLFKKRSKDNYYHLDDIKARNAVYNLIFGERSNGKTFACQEEILRRWHDEGLEGAIIRRYDDEFRGKRGKSLWAGIVAAGKIQEYTDGEWDGVYYYAGQFYFSRTNDKGEREHSETPFCHAFSLNTMESDKSTSWPNIGTIFFDEFITRRVYLTDEFVIFANVLSTIIRDRDNVKIYMAGNTVNKYCIYFNEMGLKNVPKMHKGDIDLYTYGDSRLTVAVEYADSPNEGKPSDFYFAFDNPKLSMITGGDWELPMYPHCPVKFVKHDIIFVFFLQFERQLLQGEIVQSGDATFLFFHRKTTPIQKENQDIVYTPEYDPRPNYRRKITRPHSSLETKLAYLFRTERVFYQDNEVGELVRNYLQWCATDKDV